MGEIMRNVCWQLSLGTNWGCYDVTRPLQPYGSTFTSVHQNSAVEHLAACTHPLDSLIHGCPGPHHCNCHWSSLCLLTGPCPCFLRSVLSWNRGSLCFILSPGSDASGFSLTCFSPMYILLSDHLPSAFVRNRCLGPFGLICLSPVGCSLPFYSICSPCWEGVCLFVFCRCQELAWHSRLHRTSILSALFIPLLRTW